MKIQWTVKALITFAISLIIKPGSIRAQCPIDEDVYGCLDCTLGVDCSFVTPQYLNCTAAGNLVCGETDTAPFVYCGTTSASTNEICFCMSDGEFVQDGDYSDPFSSEAYVDCAQGLPEYKKCPTGQLFFSDSGCTEMPTCTAEETIEIPSICNMKYTCTLVGPGKLEGSVEPCNDGEVFDSNTEDCINPMQESEICTEYPEVAANPNACDVYHYCETQPEPTTQTETSISTTQLEESTTEATTEMPSNESISLENGINYLGQFPRTITLSGCCDHGFIYNDVETSCTVGSCDPVPGLCVQEYFERTFCERCSSVDIQYPTDTSCSLYYFKCEEDEDDESIILPKLTKCNDATPFYDPTLNVCVQTLQGC